MISDDSDSEGSGVHPAAARPGGMTGKFPRQSGLRKDITKLDHRDVFGTRSSVADGLIDGMAPRKNARAAGRGAAGGGLDLDAGTLARSSARAAINADSRIRGAMKAHRQTSMVCDPGLHLLACSDGSVFAFFPVFLLVWVMVFVFPYLMWQTVVVRHPL